MQAEPALQERFWREDKLGFAERELLRDALLQGMGPVLQLIPTMLQGCGLIKTLVSQQSGSRCQVLWQWPLGRSASPCPCQYQNLAVWSQGKLILPVSCSYLGWGCGSLGVSSLLGDWVDLPHRRRRRAGMEHSDRHPRTRMSLGMNIWLLSGILCWKAATYCCAPSRARWELLIHQGGVRGAEAG